MDEIINLCESDDDVISENEVEIEMTSDEDEIKMTSDEDEIEMTNVKEEIEIASGEDEIEMISNEKETDEITNEESLLTENNSDNDDSEIIIPRKRAKVNGVDINQPSTSGNTPNLDNWKWENVKNVPKIKKFQAIPGINSAVLCKLEQNPTPLDVFTEVLNSSFWKMLTKQTNLCAKLNNNSYKNKKDKSWYPVVVDEMKAYFALALIMSQVKKHRVELNWSKRAIIHTPIYGQTMPFRRFLAISRFLHFTYNKKKVKSNEINKIRSVVNYLNTKFQQIYTPDENLWIDKSLMKFKGRMSYVQFITSKSSRFGINFYKLCESNSGYCVGFKIYTDQDMTVLNNYSASESIVEELTKPIINKGYTLFLDNWSSSPKLYVHLLENDINVIGTVQKNRKDMPRDLAKLKLKKGDVAARSCKNLLALRWRDQKDTYVLSTKHADAEMVDTGEKIRIKGRGGTEENNIYKPKCIIDYKHGIGGLDRQDQVLACFPIMRKFLKGYRKIFFYMFDTAMFNSYILYSKLSNVKKKEYSHFRMDIAEQILLSITLPRYNRRRRSSYGDTPLRLQCKNWSHFPRHIPPTEKKMKPARLCKVCTKHKKRSETTWECKKCLVALHVPDCFEKYHTLQDY